MYKPRTYEQFKKEQEDVRARYYELCNSNSCNTGMTYAGPPPPGIPTPELWVIEEARRAFAAGQAEERKKIETEEAWGKIRDILDEYGIDDEDILWRFE